MNLFKTYKRWWIDYKLIMISLHLMLCSLLGTNFMLGIKPIICKYKGEWFFPNLYTPRDQQNVFIQDLVGLANYDYQKLSYDFVVWPVLALDPKALSPGNAWQLPGSKNEQGSLYILGSYDLGRDVFSSCVYGLQKSLFLSILAILISGIAGIMLGSVFSFQSQRFRNFSIIALGCIVFSLISALYALVLNISYPEIGLKQSYPLYLLSCLGFMAAFYLSDKKPLKSISLDFISLRYIELMKSIPVILILLILIQIFRNPDSYTLAWIISIVYIPVIAKYTRVFTLSASNELYIDALIALGQSGTRIYFKHLIPRVFSEIIPILAFGVSNIILAEASLSFLGLGMAPDEISLGTIMYAARSYPEAWWVIVFPGLIVFWLVSSFNSLGELCSDRKRIRELQT